MKDLIDKLAKNKILTKQEFISLIENRSQELDSYLFEKARQTRQERYENKVYIRGLIEFTNYCKNDCYYCGIRKSNKNAQRYRLSKQEIMDCCKTGYSLGFRTFVLQGGEDPYFNDERLLDIVSEIRNTYKDCAITLSVGERSYESYKKLFDAGANRYLLRHETACSEHYEKLHPACLTLENRHKCLWDLKKIGYQVGTGFMVGSPFQTAENISEDLLFIYKLKPEMIGIGPFLSHHDTPFAKERNGSTALTLFLIGILRLMLPSVLLPATTALGSAEENGRELGILAGANVIMPNLSPTNVRKKYLLYDNKISTGVETAEGILDLKKQMEKIGYSIVVDRGDFIA